MSKVEKQPNGCWDFLGATRGNGYGAMKVNGKVVDAHRVSFVLAHGKVPAGSLVMHSCDNRACVNPDHLTLGTDQDNSKDAVSKGIIKPWRPKRETPLTDAELLEIRDRYGRGVGVLELSRQFNVPVTSLRRLLGLDT